MAEKAVSVAADRKPPKPPRKRGPRVDVELTRRRKTDILREAARLFDRVGYHNVNMEMIAEATGLKKPTLYHYIRGKDQILFDIQETIIGSLREAMRERREQGLGPSEILHGMFRDTFNLMHDYPGFVRVFFENMRELQGEQKERVRGGRRSNLAAVMEVVADGMDKKIFNRADVRVTALCLLGVCNWSYQWYRPNADVPPEEMADKCWEFASRGL